MPTFTKPSLDADEAFEALRGLAHATRSTEDPREIYSALGSLASGLACLEQVLHQLARFHDGPARVRTCLSGSARTSLAGFLGAAPCRRDGAPGRGGSRPCP
jgi:hypothetical protein